MATRAISVPRARTGVGERVALPSLCLIVVVAGLASLGIALGHLPSRAVQIPTVPSLVALRPPAALDPLALTPSTTWPRSRRPVGGFAFVRCTNLWLANADGSNARRLLSMPGIASPTFSPDGRTIAFLSVSPTGTEVWLAAADGSATRPLGTVAEGGEPVLADVGQLAWAPDGTRLAFSVMPGAMRGGTPTHWVLELASGDVRRVGGGGDELVWLDRQVLVAGRDDGEVRQLWGSAWNARRLSRLGDVEAIAFAPGWWAWEWQKDSALLIHRDGTLELGWKNGPGGPRVAVSTQAPEGHRFDHAGRIAIVQHGPVAVTLLDRAGERDLGLFDPELGTWRVLDYAWDAVASPAPAVTGSLEERRALELVQSLLWQIERPDRADLLLGAPLDPRIVPFHRVGFTLEEPRRVGGGWAVLVHAFGRTETGFATRDLLASVERTAGRLAITLVPTEPVAPIRTIEDAVGYLERILTVRVIGPAGLPERTRLAARPIDAWSWRGRATGSLHLAAPGAGRLTIHYGEGGLGCGAFPIPLELGTGTPAIVQDPEYASGYNAVAWPAGPKDSSGPFGIQGSLPISTLVAIAGAMDAERLET